MKALVLERKNELSVREIDIQENLGENDVHIAIKNVGVCGSDLHFYTHGAIGPFVVRKPMVLGHEAAGQIIEVGKNVTNLKVGDRVCMEPGIPNPRGRASRMGMYNLDPDVVFWAAPPTHGVTRPFVVHPAEFTYKLPENVSYEEGALVEPLAVGMHAAVKAEIKPGDIALVIGAGTIGLVTTMAAFAAGCSTVVVTDVKQPKLDLAASIGSVIPVNVGKNDPVSVVQRITGGWGVDIVFEASGAPEVSRTIFELIRPGGRVVYIGMPVEPIQLDIVSAQTKEVTIKTIFRYANVYDRAINLMGAGKIDVKPLITESYEFKDSIKAYEYAVDPKPTSVKIQIRM